MSDRETLIAMLKNNPGSVYIRPDGKILYFLVGEKLMFIEPLTGQNFNDMTEEEINFYIQKILEQA